MLGPLPGSVVLVGVAVLVVPVMPVVPVVSVVSVVSRLGPSTGGGGWRWPS
ncbi:hypothetical protein [Streptomyces sp. NPDC056244]|uniref:hypothetical protein n=1 Tax=Streptomyces sp. NPDC056244 TaxID=3345762 RepID=UPI0035DF7AFE